ncbi:MAG TPA: hypothetical protein VIC59_02395 [Gemmatimonadota bacterium]
MRPIATDEELFVRCKTCGFPVATGLRVAPGDLETIEIAPRAHRCPRCGSAHVYEKRDYFYRGPSDAGRRSAAPRDDAAPGARGG